MPYVKLLWYLHNCISFNCKYYRSCSLCPENVCGFPSSQYAGVQHVCTLTAASCKRTCLRKQLLFERIKITLCQLRTSLELNPVNTGVLRIDLQRHLLHTRKAHLSRICNDFKPNNTQQLRSPTLAKKHKQQQQKIKTSVVTRRAFPSTAEAHLTDIRSSTSCSKCDLILQCSHECLFKLNGIMPLLAVQSSLVV